ncbi:MAG: hypothetical protein QGG50_04925 [Methanopyri archaeon]|nr:hypothetical protein [Methanopyri archaeon]
MVGSGARKALEAMISVPILVFGLSIVRDLRQAPTAENVGYFVVWAVLSFTFLMWSARRGRTSTRTRRMRSETQCAIPR